MLRVGEIDIKSFIGFHIVDIKFLDLLFYWYVIDDSENNILK